MRVCVSVSLGRGGGVGLLYVKDPGLFASVIHSQSSHSRVCCDFAVIQPG